MSSKRWCFTLNHPGDYRPPYTPLSIDYLVWQLERGEAGTEHIQGYIRLKQRGLMGRVKVLLDNQGLHLERAQGSEEQNRAYCTKADTRIAGPFEHGTYDSSAGKQGTRNDLITATSLIAQGQTLGQVAALHPTVIVKYPTGMEKLIQLLAPPPRLRRELFVCVLWGPTGTGKTHRVRSMYPDLYAVNAGRDPWGRYQREETVLFDEFDWSKWPIDQMKTLLDIWPLSLDCRYADKTACYTRIYLTSQSSPSNWYLLPPTAPDKQALLRRIHLTVEVLDQQQEVPLLLPVHALPTPSATPVAPGSTTPVPPTTPVLISSDSEEEPTIPRPLKRSKPWNRIEDVD